MDLTSGPTAKYVRLSALFKYITWSKLGIQRAAIKNVDLQGNNKFLIELAVKCKSLHTLELHSGGELRQSLRDATSRGRNLKSLILGPKVPVSCDTVHAIMDGAINLEVARFGAVGPPMAADPSWTSTRERSLQEVSIVLAEETKPLAAVSRLTL